MISKKSSVSLRVSPTPYALGISFKIFLRIVMIFNKVLQFTVFEIMMYYLIVSPSPGITGMFTRCLIRRVFTRICN